MIYETRSEYVGMAWPWERGIQDIMMHLSGVLFRKLFCDSPAAVRARLYKDPAL